MSDVLSLLPHFNVLSSGARLYWLYVLAAGLIALVILFRRMGGHPWSTLRGFLAFCFPKDIYLHPSARLDYAFFIVNGSLFLLLLVPATLATSQAVGALLRGFEEWAGPPARAQPTPFLTPLLFTLAVAMAADLGLFLAHWMTHKIGLLWEFHKVHHSATVLTPITAYRFHPLDDSLGLVLSVTMAAIADRVFHHFYADVGPITVMDVSVVTFAFYIFGFHLRHSHVWLSYGPVLGRIFISPAHHQIHHSKLAEHRDKNFGVIFAIWDWMAGSLVVPKDPEPLVLGLAGDEEKEFQSLAALYFRPFQGALHHLVGRAGPGQPHPVHVTEPGTRLGG